MEKNRFKFSYDIGLAAIFMLLFAPEMTSLVFHEVVGIVLVGAIFAHLLLNKSWISGMTKKLFSKSIKGRAKFSYILNVILLIDMLVITISGLLVSEILFPNFRYASGFNWLALHIVSSFIGLVTVGIHIGLHWNWIKQIGTRFPKLSRIFSFQKPWRKYVVRSLLIVGTLFLIIQVSKNVILTVEIFSERNGHSFERRVEVEHRFTDGELEWSRGTGEFSERRDGFREDHDRFSLIRLLGVIPFLLFYSAGFGAIAYYTYLIENKGRNRRTRSS